MITVVNNNDSGVGSLRQALLDAAVGETIDFAITGVLTLASELTITQDVIIQGPGSGVLTIDANNVSRHFDVQNFSATISRLTLINGVAVNGASIITIGDLTMDSMVIHDCTASGDGGAVHNIATLIIANSNIHDNTAIRGGGLFNSGTATLTNVVTTLNTATFLGGLGGGVFNSGTIDLNDCSLSANVSDTNGFQIYNDFGGTVTFTRSTVNDAGASVAGVAAIHNDTGTIYVQNSTLSSNANMVAVYNDQGLVNFTNSTVTNNGFGLIQTPGSVCNVFDTILAGNTVLDYQGDTADVISGGYNIFGNNTNPITPAAGDVSILSFAGLLLGPLQDNGGLTLTHAVLIGSPALNAGDITGAPATDQRGDTRIVGTSIDIGAFEAGCLMFQGTLPAWATLDENCIVVPAGGFPGTTQLEANAAAQAALDSFVAAAISAGELFCNSSVAASSFVGFTLGPTQNVGTSLSLSRTLTLGNLVIVGVACVNAPAAITVTDSTGNVYTPIAPAQTAFYTAQFFYCANVTGNINTIITAHVDTAVQQSIGVWEFNGGTQGLDGFANGNGPNGPALTGDVTISQAIDALVCLISANVAPGSEAAAQAGWTLDAASGDWGAAFAHRVTSAVAAYHGAGTHVNGDEWACSFAAFT